MAPLPSRNARLAAIVAIAILACGIVPAPVVAQSGGQAGGTVTVAEGETVDGVEAFAGTVVIEGTVTGDVSAVGGDVRILGDVEGDVEAASGSVTVAGTVGGDLDAATGRLEVTDAATIGGDASAGAGTVVVDGTIEGDAAFGADTIRLGESASIAGDLRYDGDLEGNEGAVAGEVEQDSSIGPAPGPSIQPIASWVFAAYAFVANLLLGAALLALFPRFSEGVADRVAGSPLRTGLIGLGVLVAVPLLLIALAISIVGIPLAVVGGFAFAFVVWIGIVYGRFAVAAWLLGAAGLENRWVALVVGLIGGAILAQVPIVGGLANLVIFLLGLGALAGGLYVHRRAAGEREPEGSGPVRSNEPASD